MKSGRHILLDLLLNFIVNGYFLSVNNLFDSLAVFVLAGNLGCNLYSLEVIFFLHCQSDDALSDLLYFFGSCLSGNDLSMI